MLYIATVATHSERYLPVLDKMIEDKGIKLEKLGMGKQYTGHFMKDLEMIEFLKDKKEDDIVIFVDGFDSLILGNKEEIFEKFKETGKKMILSVENIRSSFLLHSYNFEKVMGKYVNTGLYMGYAGYMKNILNDIYSNDYDKNSNQKTWSRYLNSNIDRLEDFSLDNESKLFLNHSFTCNNKFKLENKRIKLNTGIEPVFIQGNGCEDLNYIINDLGYSSSNIHKDTFTRDKWKYNFRSIFKTYPVLKYFILCIVLVVTIILSFIFIYRVIRHNQVYELTFH